MSGVDDNFLNDVLKELQSPAYSATQYDGIEHDNRVRRGEFKHLNDQVRPTGKRMIEKLLAQRREFV